MSFYSKQRQNERIKIEQRKIQKTISESRGRQGLILKQLPTSSEEIAKAKRRLQELNRRKEKPLLRRDSAEPSRIPQPRHKSRSNFQNDNKVESKIPKPKFLWKRGDLLDSLDLSVANPQQHAPIKHTENKENWLEEDIRASIQQWAPKVKASRFVKKIKSIRDLPEETHIKEDEEFLQNELICVEDEENKIENSIARLELKFHKNQQKIGVLKIDEAAKLLQESIERMNYQAAKDTVVEINTQKTIPKPSGNTCEEKIVDTGNCDAPEDKDEVLMQSVDNWTYQPSIPPCSEYSYKSTLSRKDVRTQAQKYSLYQRESQQQKENIVKTNPNINIKALFMD